MVGLDFFREGSTKVTTYTVSLKPKYPARLEQMASNGPWCHTTGFAPVVGKCPDARLRKYVVRYTTTTVCTT
jgi:hypothetical protein